MYDYLRIRDFRAFSAFELPALSRVNLLVGKNNAGKTSLLEAIEMVAWGGRPASLLRSLRRRGEVSSEALDERPRLDFDVRHLFQGHKIREGASFELTAGAGPIENAVRCDVRRAQRDVPELELFPDQMDLETPLALHLTGPENQEGTTIAVSPGGTLVGDFRRALGLTSQAVPATVVFLGTEGADVYALQQIWDGLVLTPEEEAVVSAMRIIEPAIDRLAFTSRDTRSTSVAWVKLRGEEQRVPLGSLGDGTRRLLALAIYVARATGGVLLVDEIDTGLHYTTLESMWRFVIETARRLNVQVFATSHSGDCMRALAWLQTDMPELAAEVSVHRVERGSNAAVRYSASDIEIAARHHIEVRG